MGSPAGKDPLRPELPSRQHQEAHRPKSATLDEAVPTAAGAALGPLQSRVSEAMRTAAGAALDPLQSRVSEVMRTAAGAALDPLQSRVSEVMRTAAGAALDPLESRLSEAMRTAGPSAIEAAAFEPFRNNVLKALGLLSASDFIKEFQKSLLPPNVQPLGDEVAFQDVIAFLEDEGIPLYGIPRPAIARRLLKARSHEARRQVLSDRFDLIADDCAALIDNVSEPLLGDAVHLLCDGQAALKSGHYMAAQALFTVVLDTLVHDFFPIRSDRGRVVGNGHLGDRGIPIGIQEMAIAEALVWLPIWNSHLEFRRENDDSIPVAYSRHASVHGASRRQYSKRNCIQAFMLVTSLLVHADAVARYVRSEQETEAGQD